MRLTKGTVDENYYHQETEVFAFMYGGHYKEMSGSGAWGQKLLTNLEKKNTM